VISRYQSAKDRRGLLDYDDLIDKALALLGEDRAAWVHYKLDQGIDHVLIDEAQDTSPKQWEIIRLLTAEFFAGAGARAVNRTIFAVGDEKQSIFSFQGAAPREFDAMRRTFATLCAAIAGICNMFPSATRSVQDPICSAPSTRYSNGRKHTGAVCRQCKARARMAAGSDAWPRRDLGHHQAEGEARDRGLGCAVRRAVGKEPASPAGDQDRGKRQALDKAGHACR
jgi:hypothetical protein